MKRLTFDKMQLELISGIPSKIFQKFLIIACAIEARDNGLGGDRLIHASASWRGGNHLDVHSAHEPDTLSQIGTEQQVLATRA